MNIKPGILTTHPWYGELLEKGYFISDKNGNACEEFYWGGEASFPNFSKIEVQKWWKSKLKENYINNGCTGIWNDNNELELEDMELDAYKDRALYPIRMSQLAYEAFKEEFPDRRPWISSRSGYAGIQKYARSWSGDNVCDWKTLKFNQYQSLSFGLSGMPYYGHDLGGFFGPPPDRELLLRSCQTGVFQPRFTIHSWRESGEPTEPWTYPDILPAIKNFICEHYRFIPYIYDCAVDASRTGIPLDRPLCLEYPQDEDCRNDLVHSLFGPSVLKILAVEPGSDKIGVHLPAGDYWYDPLKKILLEGGENIIVEIPPETYRWFAKAGSVIPTSPGLGSLKTGFYKTVVFLIMPPANNETVNYCHFEDDGSSEMSCAQFSEWEIKVKPSSGVGGFDLTFEKITGQPELSENRSFIFEIPEGFTFADGSGRVHINPADWEHTTFKVSFSGIYSRSLV
jgi:alpha-glucosidase